MVSNVSQAVEFYNDERFNSVKVLKSSVKQLFKYSRYFSSKKHELIQYGSYLENLIEDEPFKARKDNYNNEFYNYLDSGIKKTRCTFNLLKLYKPGELLSSVSNV